MVLPDAGTKLRMVLDYLPCEACLAQPVDDQDLLCTLCARLDREVAVRVGTRTTVLIERPSAPEAPIVIPPAPSMPEAPPAPREILVRWGDEPSPERPGSLEVVVEPLAPVAPAVVPVVALAEPAPEPVAAEEADPFSVDDVAEYVPPVSDYFEFTGRPTERSFAPEPEPQPAPEAFAPPREPEPEPPAPAAEPEPAPPADDYVFRPPEDEPAVAQAEPAAVEEEILPVEEVVVESSERDQWAPPADILPEETPVEPEPEPAPAPVEEPEEEVLEMEVVEDDEEVVEMEVVEDDEPEPPAAPPAAPAAAAPAPERASAPSPSGTDLYRLRGFDAEAERALLRANITEIQHLSGHDAGELSARTGVAFDRVLPWIQVADLVHEVGVPVDAAIALVVAGVAGPRALRDADPEEVADRVAAFGGCTVQARDVARWKRRA